MALYDDVKMEQAVDRPISRGLAELLLFNIGPDTKLTVQSALEAYNRRLACDQDLISATDRLMADGYPNPPAITASIPSINELNEQIADVEAAVAALKAIAQATSVSVSLGVPTPKP